MQIPDWYPRAEHVPEASAALLGEETDAARSQAEVRQGEFWARRVEAGLAAAQAEVARSAAKQAGMRNWTYAGAKAVLRLRAALQGGTYAQPWAQALRPAD